MLALLLKEWKYVAMAALAGLLVFTSDRLADTKKALRAERVAHQTTIDTYKEAQKVAEAKVKAEVQRLKQEGDRKANEADKKYTDLLGTYRASLLRYRANQSVPSGPSSGTAPSGPPIPDRPGEGPQFPAPGLLITMQDAQICAENTARLQSARDWALTRE